MDEVYDFRKVIIRDSNPITRESSDDEIIPFYTNHLQDAATLYEAGHTAEAEAIVNILLLDPDMPFLSRVMIHVYGARLAEPPCDFNFHCQEATKLCVDNVRMATEDRKSTEEYLARCYRLGKLTVDMLMDIFQEKTKNAPEKEINRTGKLQPTTKADWAHIPRRYKEAVIRSLLPGEREILAKCAAEEHLARLASMTRSTEKDN